jgi:hypothetical protein
MEASAPGCRAFPFTFHGSRARVTYVLTIHSLQSYPHFYYTFTSLSSRYHSHNFGIMPEADCRKQWLLMWRALVTPRIMIQEQYTSLSEAQQDILGQLNGLKRKSERWWRWWVEYRCAFFLELLSFDMATAFCIEGKIKISDPTALLEDIPGSSNLSSPPGILYNTYRQRDLRPNGV